MRKLLLLITITILTQHLFSIGNNEEKEQDTTTVTINRGDSTTLELNITREDYAGESILNITKGSDYIVREIDINSVPVVNNGDTISYSNSLVNIEVSYFQTAYTDSISFFEKIQKNTQVKETATNSNVIIGVELVPLKSELSSYKFLVTIKPNITYDNTALLDENIEETLENSYELSRYFKKQILKDNFFDSTAEEPFPLVNIPISYTTIVETNNNVVTKRLEENNRPIFNSIYNLEGNNNSINTVVKKYEIENKPLFHHYISSSQEEPFNSDQYIQISVSDGQEIANSALKYLTWGIEYTPDKGVRPMTFTDDTYPSQIVNKNPDLNKWLTNYHIEDVSVRYKNYLPYEPWSITKETMFNYKDPNYNSEEVEKLKEIAGDYFDQVRPDVSMLDLSTPFIYNSTKITGVSLPYVPGGIDTPRTFNHKMLKQKEILDSYFNSTQDALYGTESNGLNDYLYSIKQDGTHFTNKYYYFYKGDTYTNLARHEPFVPGKKDSGYYRGLNLTGVDSLGLLTGSLSMTTFSKRVLNLQNSTPSTELDRYNSFDILPDFKATPVTDTANIRLNRFDIERSTVLLSNLKSLRAGDLLVRGKGEDDTEIGIVIDPGNRNLPDNDPFDISEVLVLSVTEEKGRVNLSYWGSSNTNNSFTDRPKEFLARRLIKFNGEIDSNTGEYNFTQYSVETWDIFSSATNNPLALLELDNRWIPNTGEPLTIDSIKVEDDEEYDGLRVILKAPTDLHYDTTGSEHNTSNTGNNILVNKGDGFGFFAKYVTNEETKLIKLATFNLNTLSESDLDRYSVDYNDKIFSEDGTCKNDYSLIYKKDEGIKFSFDGDKETIMFAIRPLENNIRPGDDLLLNFDFITSTGTLPVETRSDNYIATYDHKMLWRANLYIAELATDWNNENPWNAPPSASESLTNFTYKDSGEYYLSPTEKDTDAIIWYGYNEWNRIYDGKDRLLTADETIINEPDEDDYLSKLHSGAGNQVVTFNKFTYIPDVAGARTGSRSTAYAYGSSDSPFEFNDELRQQQIILADNYNDKGEKFKVPKSQWLNKELEDMTEEEYKTNIADYNGENFEESKSDTSNNDIISLNSWDKTTAPDKDFSKYITPTDKKRYGKFSDETVPTASMTNFPYRPGWALSKYFQDTSIAVPNWDNAISSGVDCNGFVSRAASYNDNNYTWPNATNQKTTDPNLYYTNPQYPYWEDVPNYQYEIVADKITNKVDVGKPIDLNKVKPGDLLYYTISASDKRGQHIAMVADVDYKSDMTAEDIRLIESTWTFDEGVLDSAKVIKAKSLSSYGNTNWVIVRPKK